MNDLVIFGKEEGVTSASVRKLMVSNNRLPEMEEPASNKIRSALSYLLTNLTGGCGYPSLAMCHPVTV